MMDFSELERVTLLDQVGKLCNRLGPDWKVEVLNKDGGEVSLRVSRVSFHWEASVYTLTLYDIPTWFLRYPVVGDDQFRECTTIHLATLHSRLLQFSAQAEVTPGTVVSVPGERSTRRRSQEARADRRARRAARLARRQGRKS